MVMPDAKPNTKSDVARSQGTDAVLSRSLDKMLLLVCLCVGVCWSSPTQRARISNSLDKVCLIVG